MLNRLKIGTKIGLGFALGLAIFSVVGWIAYQGTHQLVESAREETHTYQVLSEVTYSYTDADAYSVGFSVTPAIASGVT